MGKLYFKLAKTNLSNNKPFYIPYIISSIITVAMLYMMSFLSDNKGLNKIMGADSLAIIFRLGVGIIVIFSYIFLFYTNSFIIKGRKKERKNGRLSLRKFRHEMRNRRSPFVFLSAETFS